MLVFFNFVAKFILYYGASMKTEFDLNNLTDEDVEFIIYKYSCY